MKHKKLVAIVLTIISATCISVGFSGCKDDEISLPPMTETASVVDKTYSEMDYYIIPREYRVNNRSMYSEYTNFVKYYNGEFKQVCDKKFYFINDVFVEPEEQRWFHIGSDVAILVEKDSETENGLVNPIVNCQVTVSDIYVGSSSSGSVAPWTIRFDAYFLPVEEETDDIKLTLKFGNSERKNYKYYINLYKGNICIGTAYFRTEVSITLEWFENFFTRHLVYGG